MPRLARWSTTKLNVEIVVKMFFTHDDRRAYLNWLDEYSKEHQTGKVLQYRPQGRPKKLEVKER